MAPATLYILTDETKRIYGGLHIRHYLTHELRLFGGHIGYGIRPSERGKGLGKLQLELGLQKAKEMGLNRARSFNNKGIVNEYRRPKLAYGAVRDAYKEIKEK